MMTMSCYYSPHDDSEGAPQHDNETPRPREQESKSNDDPFQFQEDHSHVATSTSSEANTALTMSRAAKKQRTSDNCSLSPSTSTQSHLYQYQQKSSSVRVGELNEKCSSAFASMPNMYKEEEEASTDKEVGKKPSQVHPQEQEGGDPNPINDTIMRNPFLPHRCQVFSPSPSHAQLHLSPSSHFHPPHYKQHDKHENPDDNPLPLSLAVPCSPVRRQFGDEYYISPIQERPAPAAHLKKNPPPSAAAAAAAVATEEMKAKCDGGEDSVDLPPPLPFLPEKGVRSSTSTSSQRNAWDRKFNELLQFKQQHGHFDVPQTYAPNPKLGLWVNKQRMEQKNREDGNISTLTDERLERLQSIGFRWAKRRGQVRWDEKYSELIQYAAKFGNCHVPTKYEENTALGRWVSTQRAEYKKYCKGEKSSLTAEKIRRLDSIGFAWFMSL